MGLGSALSEKEGAVSPPPFLFYCKNTSKWHGLAGKNIIALDASGELVVLMLAVLVHVQLEALKLVGREELLLVT